MRPKSLLLLVLALGCGLVASIGITQVMAKRDGNTTATVETEPVLVATEKIPQFKPLSAQLLKVEQWPKGKVPEGAVTKLEDVEGRRTRGPIYPGEAILEYKLFQRGDGQESALMLIPKGYRVITVKVDSVSGGSGLILPGDRVDVAVVLRADLARGIPETTTKTFLQDIKVFAVNDQFQIDSSEDDKTITAKTVSLLVTPEQAQDVLVAAEAGKIQLVMRSPDEEQQAEVEASSLSKLLGMKREGGNRAAEKLFREPSPQPSSMAQKFKEWLDKRAHAASASGADAVQTTPEPTRPETWQVEVIKADQVEQVVLENQQGKWRVANSAGFAPAPAPSPGTATPPPTPQDPPQAEPAATSDGPADDGPGDGSADKDEQDTAGD